MSKRSAVEVLTSLSFFEQSTELAFAFRSLKKFIEEKDPREITTSDELMPSPKAQVVKTEPEDELTVKDEPLVDENVAKLEPVSTPGFIFHLTKSFSFSISVFSIILFLSYLPPSIRPVSSLKRNYLPCVPRSSRVARRPTRSRRMRSRNDNRLKMP